MHYITIHCDSHSVIFHSKDQMFHERTKYIDVIYHFIQRVIAEGDIKVCKIRTHDSTVYMLTKSVFAAKLVGVIV